MSDKWVQMVDGVPLLRDFVGLIGDGPPLCIDQTTGVGYYLRPSNTPSPLQSSVVRDADALGADPYATYYVNAATGNDSNNGLTAGTSWKTLEYAMGYVASLRWKMLTGYAVISLADGNYSTTSSLNGDSLPSTVGYDEIQITSTSGIAANVHINVNGALVMNFGSTWLFYKVTLDNMGFTAVYNGGIMNIDGCICNVAAGATHFARANQGGHFWLKDNIYNLPASMQYFVYAYARGWMTIRGTHTFNLNTAFSVAFLNAENDAFYLAAGVTYNGAGVITGTRYRLLGLSRVYTNNAGASALPGNAAGSIESNSIYY